MGDVLLLLLVVGGSVLLPGRRRLSWLLVAAGIIVNVLGDTANLLQTSHLLRGTSGGHVGIVVDEIAWPASILLMWMAMWLSAKSPGSG